MDEVKTALIFPEQNFGYHGRKPYITELVIEDNQLPLITQIIIIGYKQIKPPVQ
jgi:hypothetical protein